MKVTIQSVITNFSKHDKERYEKVGFRFRQWTTDPKIEFCYALVGDLTIEISTIEELINISSVLRESLIIEIPDHGADEVSITIYNSYIE